MKLYLLVVCALVVCLSGGQVCGEIEDGISTGTFTTNVDHFTPQDQRTAELTYLYNDRYAKENGPLLVLINTANVNATQFLRRSLLHTVAQDVNGTLISFETRNFGSNNVTADLSVNNLSYLTIEQILADVANLATAIRKEFNSTRVILTGSGLGGTLATWARQRYPHLIYATWSSSGVFNRSVHTNVPFETLTEILTEHGGQECVTNVQNAFENTELELQDLNVFYIRDTFHLCTILFPYYEDEMALFFSGLINYIAQYINANNHQGVVDFCTALNTTGNRTIEKVFGDWIWEHYGNGECVEFDYEENVERLEEFSLDSDAVQSGDRQNLYLQCTQLANRPTSVNADTVFGRTIAQDFYKNICEDVIGFDRYDYLTSIQALNNLKVQFGTTNPGTSRAIFSNGLLDHYHKLGIVEDDDQPDNYVINISNAGRSADLFELNEEDNESTAAAKFAIHEILVKWSTQD